MNTISKIAAGSALAAVMMYAPANAHAGWRVGVGIGWPFYCGPYYAPYPYYYYPPAYYPPATYYQAPPVVYSAPEPSAPNSPAPTTNYSPARPAPQPQATPPVQPMSVGDVKALVKAGITEEVVISQIMQTRVVFRLTTAEIIDLKESGVSNKVIDFMINTASRQGQ